MGPDQSKEFYDNFLEQMKQTYAEDKIKGIDKMAANATEIYMYTIS